MEDNNLCSEVGTGKRRKMTCYNQINTKPVSLILKNKKGEGIVYLRFDLTEIVHGK